MANSTPRIDIEQPRWDQGTYWGRAKHFFVITNPLNLLCSTKELENSKNIVTRYRAGSSLQELKVTEDELWRAKGIYDSAFHPDTGEKMILIGRMSAQVPMNMFITGGMLSFYRSNAAVIFWQWFNQSFNATVNYTNRSGNVEITTSQLLTSYTLATSCALVTALSFNRFTAKASQLVQRFVPFLAVSAANCVNIPVVRMREIQMGTKVVAADGKALGESTVAAKRGIAAVIVSRIMMAVPTMILIPIIMDKFERNGTLKKCPKISTPAQIGLCGLILTVATPLGCALFPQQASISVSALEPELQERIKKESKQYTTVYYNKGL